MSENCPKCGSEFDQQLEEELPRGVKGTVTYWGCGSYVRSFYGEHIQSTLCKLIALEAALAAATKQLQEIGELFDCTPDRLKQEVVEAREMWDRIARLAGQKQKDAEAKLAAATKRAEEAEAENDSGREVLRQAWREFNAIRARDGAPAGVCHEYWNEMTESLRALVGDEDAKPWMTKATRELIRPYENRNADLSSRLVDAELALAASEVKLLAAEQENARLREGIAWLECDIRTADLAQLPEECDEWEAFAAALLSQSAEAIDGNN